MKTTYVMMMGLLGAASLAVDAHAGNSRVAFGFSQSVASYDAPVVYNAPAPVVYSAPPQQQQYCREYNGQVIVGGRYQQSYGTACMQPDGAWQIQTPNGVGTPVGYIAPPAQPVTYYAGPTTYYNPPVYSNAPIYYTPPTYNRSSFSVFYGNGGNNWNHGNSFRGPDCDDDRGGWGGHRVYRDNWNRGHGGGWGHGGRHGGGHWR